METYHALTRTAPPDPPADEVGAPALAPLELKPDEPEPTEAADQPALVVNQTLEECITGIDSNPSSPDAGCTIYLASDGSIRNYGFPVWFDPDPSSRSRRSVRVIGYSHRRRAILTIILVRRGESAYYGANGWESNPADQRRYREGQ